MKREKVNKEIAQRWMNNDDMDLLPKRKFYDTFTNNSIADSESMSNVKKCIRTKLFSFCKD